MNTHESSSVEAATAADRPTNLIPVILDVSYLGSTTLSHLRNLKAGLAEEGYLPAELTVEARFGDDTPLAVQPESDRPHEYVHAATFLGVERIAVDVAKCCRPDDTESAFAALDERARREGVAFELRSSING